MSLRGSTLKFQKGFKTSECPSAVYADAEELGLRTITSKPDTMSTRTTKTEDQEACSFGSNVVGRTNGTTIYKNAIGPSLFYSIRLLAKQLSENKQRYRQLATSGEERKTLMQLQKS